MTGDRCGIKLVDLDARRPDRQDIIKCLEGMLARAKSGEIDALAVAWIDREDYHRSEWIALHSEALTMAAVLQDSVLRNWRGL